MNYVAIILSLSMLCSCTVAPIPNGATSNNALVTHEAFFVGGTYVGPKGKELMDGQMYVEILNPPVRQQPQTLVFIHGAAQTSINWLSAPDGRRGWADFFLAKGYRVVLVDQPWRGRSAWHSSIGLDLHSFSVPTIERLFTSIQPSIQWPQAKLHTQWPGAGRMGDPVFDQFMSSQVDFVPSNVKTQNAMRAAGAALMDKIGPAILITHSQAGPFGWLIADARPQLVKAIIAIEPQGPPMQDAILGEGRARAWGIADVPLTYDGVQLDETPLSTALEDLPDRFGLVRCWTQSGMPRQLTNLRNIPVLVEVGEASYHAPYDHCTAKWLAQAGVPTTFIRLEDVGIHGNGHMQMLELNSEVIAEVLHGWIAHLK